MSIASPCPGCREVLTFGDHLRGKKVRCKKCGHIFVAKASARKDEDAAIQTPPRRAARVADREDEEMPPPPRRRRSSDDSLPALRRSNWGLYFGLGMAGLTLLILGVGLVFAVIYFSSTKGGSLDVLNGEFGGSWPQPRPFDGLTPEDTIVTLHIAAVANDETREAIMNKAMQLPDGGRGGTSTASQGDRTTILLTPVRDPKACADRIDFGTVRRIDGRVICVVANKVEGLPANADAVTKALHELKSSNPMRRTEAASRLKTMAPNERRNEVARALEAALKDPNPFAQKEIVDALEAWATKESVPALLEALATRDPFSRKAIFNVLTHFPDEHVCEVLAKHLEDFADRAEAGAALRSIGSMAEKAVLKRLRHSDVFLRQEVCKILITIGTQESLPALKDVVAEGEFFTKNEAEQAYQLELTRMENAHQTQLNADKEALRTILNEQVLFEDSVSFERPTAALIEEISRAEITRWSEELQKRCSALEVIYKVF